MSQDESGLSRRRVLASLGGVGAVGMVNASGTNTLFSGEKKGSGTAQAGKVDVYIDCDSCAVDTGRVVGLGFDAIKPGTTESKMLRLGVMEATGSVRLWLRTQCPPAADPLGEILQTRVSVTTDCRSGNRERLFPVDTDWVSFNQLRRELHDGIRIDDPANPCIDPDETRCLLFEYHLPENVSMAVDTESTLVLELLAQQCQNVPESSVEPPFEMIPCPDIDYDSCVLFGRVNVDGSLDPETTYSFDELSPPFDTDSYTYSFDVLTVTDAVIDGEHETVCVSFRLLKDGSESAAPLLCKVTVDARQFGSETVDINPPLTRTRNELCATTDEKTSSEQTTSSQQNDESQRDDGSRPVVSTQPVISTITVYVCASETGEVITNETITRGD